MKTKALPRTVSHVDPQAIDQQTIVEAVSSIQFLSHSLSSALTPRSQRDQIFTLGQVLAALPFLVFTLPVILQPPDNFSSGFMFAISLMVVLVTVLAFALVSFCRSKVLEISQHLDHLVVKDTHRKFNHVLYKMLSIRSQLVYGGMIAAAVIFLVFLQSYQYQMSLFGKVFLVIGGIYIGFIWGTAIYAVFCIPEMLAVLAEARFEVKSIYPYQQPELRKISDTATSITVTGGWFTTLLISMLVICQLVAVYRFSAGSEVAYLFLVFLEVAILLCAYIVLGILFAGVNSFINQVIKQAKAERLDKFNLGLQKLIEDAQNGNADAAEQIKKIQALIDQIDSSPNSVLAIGTVGKLLSTLLFTILPLLLSKLITGALP